MAKFLSTRYPELSINLIHKPPIMKNGFISDVPPQTVKFQNRMLDLPEGELADALRETQLYKTGEILEIDAKGQVTRKKPSATSEASNKEAQSELSADAGLRASGGADSAGGQPGEAGGEAVGEQCDAGASGDTEDVELPETDSGDSDGGEQADLRPAAKLRKPAGKSKPKRKSS